MSIGPETWMSQAIEFAKTHNKIWPFSAVIVDADNQILVHATDCAHISPIYHAESLAIHILITQVDKNSYKRPLKLITTAECDTLSQSAVYWANIVHELCIEEVYYGLSLEAITTMWPFGIQINSREIMEHSTTPDLKIEGPILNQECLKLFEAAKKLQAKINQDHPTEGIASTKLEDFYQIGT